MKATLDTAAARDVAKRIGAPVATTAALDALPAASKFDGQRRTVLADYSDWVYRSETDDWVPFTPGDGPGPDHPQEWTNPVAAAAAGLHAATAVSVAVQTLLTADLITGGKTALAAFPRNVTFTTAGNTPSDAPATATITGTDIDDAALTETVNVAQTATIAAGVKAFKTITSIVYSAGQGTDATVAVGFGAVFGLAKKAKVRAGAVAVVKEYVAGAIVTNGVFATPTTSPPYGSYAPNTAPDGANDYAVRYERDLS